MRVLGCSCDICRACLGTQPGRRQNISAGDTASDEYSHGAPKRIRRGILHLRVVYVVELAIAGIPRGERSERWFAADFKHPRTELLSALLKVGVSDRADAWPVLRVGGVLDIAMPMVGRLGIAQKEGGFFCINS